MSFLKVLTMLNKCLVSKCAFMPNQFLALSVRSSFCLRIVSPPLSGHGYSYVLQSFCVIVDIVAISCFPEEVFVLPVLTM